jgi:hypothetical protein
MQRGGGLVGRKCGNASGTFSVENEVERAAWQERAVPKEWADAIIVPIPQQGNLWSCDNWRGIALLEVVGKVVARVIQGRLQRLAERETCNVASAREGAAQI